MDFKPIDMQMPIPRTHDAGEVQNLQKQKPSQDQIMLAQESRKIVEQERKKSTKIEQSAEGAIEDQYRDSHEPEQNLKRKQEQQKKQEQNSAKHPFKGNYIDFSL